MNFKSIDIVGFGFEPFKKIAKEWFLISAGTKNDLNFMTAGWGGFGILWNKNIAVIFVRPTRHTYGYLERTDHFTMSFFNKEYVDALKIAGSRSGRDTDKLELCKLTPLELEDKCIGFEQADLIFNCKKIYYDDLKPGNFMLPDTLENYPQKDFHRFYIGEILSIYKKIQD